MRSSLSIPVALFVLLALAGCAEEPAMKLVETKSAVQLLRNETATRVPEEMIGSVENTADLSEECDSGDPIRRWQSTALINVSPQFAGSTRDVYRKLVDSYVSDGWKEGNVGDRQAVLSNESSLATIDILMVSDADGDGEGASLRIMVTGPCVTTGGAQSEEVLQLEARD